MTRKRARLLLDLLDSIRRGTASAAAAHLDAAGRRRRAGDRTNARRHLTLAGHYRGERDKLGVGAP